MTPRERAEKAFDALSLVHGYRAGYGIQFDDVDRKAIIAAITAAIEAERERCAKVAERFFKIDYTVADDIAAAIRAGEPCTPPSA